MVDLKRKLKSLIPSRTKRESALRNVLTIEWNGTSTPLIASPRTSGDSTAGAGSGGWRRMEEEESEPLTGGQTQFSRR